MTIDSKNTYDGNDMLPTPAADPQLGGPMPLDYRNEPNLGTNEQRGPVADYDNPIDGTPASPPVDQTWKSYDEQLDATRFGGFNSPETSAAIFAEPDPHGHQGWSPDLDDALKFERAENGAPA